jgi:hypothetical protein
MIVESRPMLNLGRKNTGPNPFLDDATSPEDLEWLEEYGDKATAEILAVGRQLDGITSDMLLRLAGVRVGENHSLNSRLGERLPRCRLRLGHMGGGLSKPNPARML